MSARVDDLLDDRARQVAKKVAAEADAYMARLLLKDFISALQVEHPVERQQALSRVELEVQAFLDSGETGAQGEGAPVSSGETS